MNKSQKRSVLFFGSKGRTKLPRVISLVICLLSVLSLWSQEEEEEIGTETVTVVKPFSPSVADAFKIKVTPKINDSLALVKKGVSYSINSVPVESTFTPAKAKAAKVEKKEAPKLFNSYAAVGLGNYSNAILDFFTSQEIGGNDLNFDAGLSHFSSRGEIDDTPLDTDFYNTDIMLDLTKKDRDMNWNVGLDLGHKRYNWYGINAGQFTENQIAGIDEGHNYFNVGLDGGIEFAELAFKGADLKLSRFWDDLESAENRAALSAKGQFPLSSETLELEGFVDYVGGTFENGSLNFTQNLGNIDYGQLIVGASPSIMIYKDDLEIKLGAKFVYGSDLEQSEGNFYIYPNVTASYGLVPEVAILYGGIEGGLDQNTYQGFVEENPFVSPTLLIQPTDRQYNGYLGLKGQLLPKLSYNLKASYKAENRKPLFLLNPISQFRNDEGGYNFGNSFQLFYDDVKTLGFLAGLSFDVNNDFVIGGQFEFFNYNTETDNPAWNLPELKASATMDYQITDQWFLGGQIFYIGEREDLVSTAAANVAPNLFASSIVTLDGYFDANAHVGYRFNDQLSLTVKLSNLASNDYERWHNFRVQGFQALAKVAYKFDL